MSISGKNIVEKAKSYIGKVTYSFGADDIENGIGDCSSFTHHIFLLFGEEIGRDTEAQYSSGIDIAKSDIKEGDLIFFKNTYNSNKKNGVSHVGIYTGNNEFIHLGNEGVALSSMDTSYWKEHYLGAKRYTEYDSKNENLNVNLAGKITIMVVIIFLIIGGCAFLGLSIFSSKGGNLHGTVEAIQQFV